ncbi:hypothetical protein ACFL20_12275 [Spirochaetota bacterium]
METKAELLNKLQKLKDEYSNYIVELAGSLERLKDIQDSGNVGDFNKEEEDKYDKERLAKKKRIEKEVKEVLLRLESIEEKE